MTQTLSKKDRPSVLLKVTLVRYYPHSHLQDITFWLILLCKNQEVAGSKHPEPDNKEKVSLTHATRSYKGADVSLHSFLIPEPDGDEWLGSRSGSFNPRNGTPLPLSVGECVDSRDGLEDLKKRKIFCRYRDSNTGSPSS
jgi:hypothetical protein